MPHLLLLTNRYPYAPGEEYLHTEVPFLAEKFDSVTILPLMKPKGAVHSRELPDNVRVAEVSVNHGRRARLLLTLKGLIQQSVTDEARSIKQKVYERYFQARTMTIADRVAPEIERTMDEQGIVFDVAYAYWFYITASVATELRHRIPRLAKLPIVARGHGYDVNEAASPVGYLPWRRYLLSSVERVHPTADAITGRLQTEWPDFRNKISTRRLGVNPAGQTTRDSGGQIRILSCSSFSTIKRLPLMAESVAKLKQQGCDVSWTHIGSGGDSKVNALKAKIASLKIQENVHLVGQKTNEEVYSILKEGHHNVFLNVSSSESVSFSMSEAMGAGLPVVGTDVVGTREILKDKVNGRLLPANSSPDDIGVAIRWVVEQSPEAYERLQQEAFTMCETTFAPARLYGTFSEDLLRLAER